MSIVQTQTKVDEPIAVAVAEKPVAAPMRLSAIDGLRAVAALFVYLYHTWQFAGMPTLPVSLGSSSLDILAFIGTGCSGVDLFMILSGLCLFLLVLRAKPADAKFSATKFWNRRAWRLLPGYYASMIFVVAVPTMLFIAFKALHLKASIPQYPSAWQWITHICLIHTFFTDTWSGFYGPWWSLGVEAQLYLMFPIAVWAYKKWSTRAFPVIMAVSVLYQIAVSRFTQGNYDLGIICSINFLGRWIEFALGMAIAWAIVNPDKLSTIARKVVSTPVALPGAALFYWLAYQKPPAPWTPSMLICLAASYGLIVSNAICTKGALNRLLGSRPLVFMGTISYSFYLVHQCLAWYASEFMRRFCHLDGTPLFIGLLSVGLPVVIAVAYGFFLLFEKPFLQKAKS